MKDLLTELHGQSINLILLITGPIIKSNPISGEILHVGTSTLAPL